ncbi:MAG: HAD family hydrolase [Candidatus Xiphinematobacter sp.]|nr:MAG: HAD family hydrolase [Candidatus Xiphinematobacter sp.]
MGVRAIIFDLDDTLITDEAASMLAFEEVGVKASRFGIIKIGGFIRDCQNLAHKLWSSGPCHSYCDSVGISALECLWGRFTDEQEELRRLRNWAIPFRKAVFSVALQRQLPRIPPDVGLELSEEFSQARRKFQILMPDAKEVLACLYPRYCLGMLTNGAPSLQREKIAVSGLEPFFQAISISGEKGIGKPRAEIFFQLIEKLDTLPSKVIMVGNSEERDVAGARNAGIRSVWFHAFEAGERPQPYTGISALRELPALVREMDAHSR